VVVRDGLVWWGREDEEGTYDLHARAQGLLAQNVFVCVYGLDGLLGVDGSDGGDNDGFEARVLQHLVVVGVDLGAKRHEVRLRPRNFRLLGRERGNQLSPRGAVEEVEGVASAHAAETGDSDLEFAGTHCGGFRGY
jgi:hypothetical protein